MNSENFILMMLRAALTGKTLHGSELPSEPYHSAMDFAAVQSVSGLVAHTLMDKKHKIILSKYDAADCFTISRAVSEQNKVVNDALYALVKLLNNYHIPFLVFKGQTLSVLYHDTYERCSGDIDFYVNPSDFKQAVEVIGREWDVDVTDSNSPRHWEFEYNDVSFEMHFRILKFFNNRIQKFFNSFVDHSSVVSIKVPLRDSSFFEVPTLEYNLNIVYTFLHLWHHLLEQGIALRQFCDLWVLIHQHAIDSNYKLDIPLLNEVLTNMGYYRAFCAIGSILIDQLQLPADEFPFKIEKCDRDYAPKILNIVLERGNFGRYGRANNSHGLMHVLETGWRQISSYLKFYQLSPRENRSLLFKEIPMKIIKADW